MWRIIANFPDDSIEGVHRCNIQEVSYWVKLNVPLELPEPVLSYFQNSVVMKIPGIDLTDDNSYVDIRKKNYETVTTKRFDVTEA
jgi:hypothetical protein